MSTSEEVGDGSIFPGFSGMAGDPVELIDRLSELRRSRGLSQTEVAARMGTSQSALARLESGQADVRVSTLARYAAALDADIGFAVRDREKE
jgi:transcriptional regulator with XRE-family HTH domain